jgi:hypothetical protein
VLIESDEKKEKQSLSPGLKKPGWQSQGQTPKNSKKHGFSESEATSEKIQMKSIMKKKLSLQRFMNKSPAVSPLHKRRVSFSSQKIVVSFNTKNSPGVKERITVEKVLTKKKSSHYNKNNSNLLF